MSDTSGQDPDDAGTVLTFPDIHPNPPSSPIAATGSAPDVADPMAAFGNTYTTLFDDGFGCRIVLVGDCQHRTLLIFRDDTVIALIGNDDVATAVATELLTLPEEGRRYSGAAMILTIGLIGGNGLWLAETNPEGET